MIVSFESSIFTSFFSSKFNNWLALLITIRNTVFARSFSYRGQGFYLVFRDSLFFGCWPLGGWRWKKLSGAKRVLLPSSGWAREERAARRGSFEVIWGQIRVERRIVEDERARNIRGGANRSQLAAPLPPPPIKKRRARSSAWQIFLIITIVDKGKSEEEDIQN